MEEVAAGRTGYEKFQLTNIEKEFISKIKLSLDTFNISKDSYDYYIEDIKSRPGYLHLNPNMIGVAIAYIIMYTELNADNFSKNSKLMIEQVFSNVKTYNLYKYQQDLLRYITYVNKNEDGINFGC